jgi:hypothetical protein
MPVRQLQTLSYSRYHSAYWAEKNAIVIVGDDSVFNVYYFDTGQWDRMRLPPFVYTSGALTHLS